MPKTTNLYKVSIGSDIVSDYFYVSAETLKEAVAKGERRCDCHLDILRVEYIGELRG